MPNSLTPRTKTAVAGGALLTIAIALITAGSNYLLENPETNLLNGLILVGVGLLLAVADVYIIKAPDNC
jgi:multisubunit Na+/H+ antiporter MnhB subunit